MSKYLLLLLIFFSSCVAYGQTYVYMPIPTSNAVWKATNSIVMPGPGSNCTKYNYSMEGVYTVNGADTFHTIRILGKRVIDYPGLPGDRHYEALTFINSCYIGTAFNFPFTASGEDTVWMVERNKKVYILDSLVLDTLIHRPYLDFNMSAAGQWYRGPRYTADSVIVTNVDTVNVSGTLRKRIIVQYNFAGPQIIDTIIEGIGSARFGLGFKDLLEEGVDLDLRARLYCFSNNSQLEYQYSNSSCADVWPTSIGNNLPKDEDIIVSPNPFTDVINIGGSFDGTVQVYNTIGSIMYEKYYSHSTKTSVPTANWPPGMYMVITESEGGRSTKKLIKY